MKTTNTSQLPDPYRGLRLVYPERRKSCDLDLPYDDSHLPNDPLEDMLRGIELPEHELILLDGLADNDYKIVTKEGRELQRKTKQLRYYLNEISLHLELDL